MLAAVPESIDRRCPRPVAPAPDVIVGRACVSDASCQVICRSTAVSRGAIGEDRALGAGQNGSELDHLRRRHPARYDWKIIGLDACPLAGLLHVGEDGLAEPFMVRPHADHGPVPLTGKVGKLGGRDLTGDVECGIDHANVHRELLHLLGGGWRYGMEAMATAFVRLTTMKCPASPLPA